MPILGSVKRFFGQRDVLSKNENKGEINKEEVVLLNERENIEKLIKQNELYSVIVKANSVLESLLNREYNYYYGLNYPKRMSYKETVGSTMIEVESFLESVTLTVYQNSSIIAKFKVFDNISDTIEYATLKVGKRYQKTVLLKPSDFKETFTLLNNVCTSLKENPHNLLRVEALKKVELDKKEKEQEIIKNDPLTLLINK